MGGGRRCSIRQRDVRVPCGYRPIERGKDEIGWSARRQHEIGCAAVGDDTRGRTGWRLLVIRISRWNGDDQGLFRPGPLYRVATPVALSASHQVLPEERDRTQELTNLRYAASETSD